MQWSAVVRWIKKNEFLSVETFEAETREEAVRKFLARGFCFSAELFDIFVVPLVDSPDHSPEKRTVE